MATTKKLPEGVEYNPVKNQYRAALNARHSMYFETAQEASQVYKLAVKYPKFFELNFPDYLR